MDGESYENPALAEFLNAAFRLHQGGSGRAAGRRCALPARGPGADPAGRLAADRVSHARGRGVLRRHLLPARWEVRTAGIPHRARRACSTPIARAADRCRRRRRRSAAWSSDDLDEAAPGEPSLRAARRRASRRMAPGVRPGKRRVRRPAQVPPPRRDDPAAPSLVRPAGRAGAQHHRPDAATAWREAASTTSSAAGFHRYSVDAEWIVPHFEKMSYDNSELLKAYLDAYALFGTEEYARRPAGIVRWVREVMADPGRRLRGQPGRRRGSGRRRRLLHLDPGRGGGGAGARGDGGRGRLLRHRHRRRDAPQPGQERAVRRRDRRRHRGRATRPARAGGPRAPRGRRGEASRGRARAPRAVRGPHPVRQLERHDGLGHAPRRRGPGRRRSPPARAAHPRAAPRRAGGARTPWRTRRGGVGGTARGPGAGGRRRARRARGHRRDGAGSPGRTADGPGLGGLLGRGRRRPVRYRARTGGGPGLLPARAKPVQDTPTPSPNGVAGDRAAPGSTSSPARRGGGSAGRLVRGVRRARERARASMRRRICSRWIGTSRPRPIW